jgi:FAD synthetase
MTKVMTFGTFDLLHPGHRDFLRQAKQHGDELVVVIARDATVERTKGRKPVHSENERLAAVKQVPGVDRAILGRTDDVYRVIAEEQPNIICLGYDQTHFVDKLAAKLKEFKLEAKIIRLSAYKPEQYKTSKIKSALPTAATQ